MMWNFLVGALLPGASIVLFDGNPGHPDLTALWDLAEEAQATTFGTSAAFLAACQKAGIRPAHGRDLGSLRAVGSTGSPLSPEGYGWVFDEVGDVWLFSTSGGTDVCTAFVGGVPTLPVHRGELQARALGCAVESWDEDGRPVVGEVGELVVTRPMPSMPLGFWNDPDGSRLRAAYFEHFPGIWRHGDWIELSERGTAVISGRSDSTINRGGVRMGTAEIYRAVLAEDAVLDALVVDVPREGAEAWMGLFVVLRPGEELSGELVAAIRRRVRSDCSPRHVPDEVLQVAEVPRTLSGKVLEVPVKRILMGVAPERAASRESLANPAALEPFVALAAERGRAGGVAPAAPPRPPRVRAARCCASRRFAATRSPRASSCSPRSWRCCSCGWDGATRGTWPPRAGPPSCAACSPRACRPSRAPTSPRSSCARSASPRSRSGAWPRCSASSASPPGR
jgi:acetoacetyl-CoA synthetase